MPVFLLTKAKLIIPLMMRNRYLTALIVMLLIGFLGWYIHHRIDQGGYERGVDETTQLYEIKQQQLRDMYQSIIDEQELQRVKIEAGIALELSKLEERHRNEIGRMKYEADLAIAKHVSGASRLSINTVSARAAASESTGTPSACSGDNGTSERRELAPEAAEFLVREAEYATSLAERLRSCQSTIRLYLNKTQEYNDSLVKQK